MSGTPASLSGSAANARKSGSECTWTSAEPLSAVQSRGHPHRAREELEVLAEVDAEPGALVALDVESVERDAGDDVLGGLAGKAQAEDDDRATGGDEQFGLAADARVLLVVAVDDHRDGAAAGWRVACRSAARGAPGEAGVGDIAFEAGSRSRPAFSGRSTIRHPGGAPGAAGSARPREESTVSTTRSASA